MARYKKKLPLKRERKLISMVKKGNAVAQKELLAHLYGFFLFRIHTTLYPSIIKQDGEDIFQECVLLTQRKIHTYRPRYRNKDNEFHPVHLSTYMWKSITGLMFAYVRKKREIRLSDLSRVAEIEKE